MAKIKSETIKKSTGKNWDEWHIELNLINANELNHKDLANLLKDKFKLSPWYSQTIAVDYEQYIGKRQVHEKSNGYEISVSKIIDLPVQEIYDLFLNRDFLLKSFGTELKIRKSNKIKNIIFEWEDPKSKLDIQFNPKANKTQVVIQHRELTINDFEEMKRFWKLFLLNFKK